MKLFAIEAGNFKLDGGAMFGVVPKSLWNRTNPADDNNMIEIASRCLLIVEGERKILIDTGMGNKQSDKFFGYYYRWGSYTIQSSLAKYGYTTDDITDVFLTHLHFDHCGGCIQWNGDQTKLEPVFKNAKYWSNEAHWQWAIQPNSREKASFLKQNILPIQESGQLHFVNLPEEGNFVKQSELGFGIFFADGHTDKQMLPIIQYQDHTIAYVADLVPTLGHIPIPYVMGYDTRPLLTLEEKTYFLEYAASNNYYLFLEHDPHHELITVQHTDKGVRLKDIYNTKDFF